MHIQPLKDGFQAVQRQMIGQFAGDDVRQQPRTGQAFFDGLGRFEGDLDVGFAVALNAPLAAGLAGVFVADVLEHLKTGGHIFELFADLLADAAAELAAAGAELLLRGKVMFDGTPRQGLRQFAPAVLMLDAAGGKRFAGLLLDGGGVDRQRIHHQTEEQQLRGIESLGLGSIDAAEDRFDLRLVPLLHCLDGCCGFALNLCTIGTLLHQQFFEHRRIIGKCVGCIHALYATYIHI